MRLLSYFEIQDKNKLLYLTLSNNKLTRIPGKELGCSKWIYCYLAACYKTILGTSKKSISKLKLLKELFLDNNGIRLVFRMYVLRNDYYVMLKTLKTIKSTIRQKTFENNEQLEWLHLGNISTSNPGLNERPDIPIVPLNSYRKSGKNLSC